MRPLPLASPSAVKDWGDGLRAFLVFLAFPLFFVPFRAVAEVAYPPVVPGYELAFPRDEGSHPDFRIEWWYVTGQLDDAGSKVKAPRAGVLRAFNFSKLRGTF